MKYKLLDLFCKAGGCTKGYQDAGFYVVGVDIEPQPHYIGDEFIQADALTLDIDFMRSFDAIHASPPCQAHTVLFPKSLHGKEYNHPDLIDPTRKKLCESGKPYIIENVPNAPLKNPVTLCGNMFGLKVYRHRLFECSYFFFPPDHPKHTIKTAGKGRTPKDDKSFWTITGHIGNLMGASRAMGIEWMNMKELVQAIPPAYTEFIGKQLIKYLDTMGA